MRYTVNDVADKLRVEVEVARGLTRFLLEIKLIRRVGNRKPENGRGASADVFDFPDGFEKQLMRVLIRAAF